VKRIVFLCLAIVLALGALGVGYASWTDKVTVTGTVHTGKVSIEVTDYSGMYVWKTPGYGDDDTTVVYNSNAAPAHAIDAFPFTDGPKDAWQDSGGLPLFSGSVDPVAWCQAAAGATDHDVVVAFANLFPLQDSSEQLLPYEANFVIHNNGSIPVMVRDPKVADWIDWDPNTVGVQGPPNSMIAASVIADLSTDGGKNWTLGVDPKQQLEPCYLLRIRLQITVAEADNAEEAGLQTADDLANQGLSGTITGSIEVVQYNEE